LLDLVKIVFNFLEDDLQPFCLEGDFLAIEIHFLDVADLILLGLLVS